MLCGIDIVYLCIIIFMYLCICFFCVLVHLCIYAFVHLYFIVVDLAVHYQDCGRQWEMLSGKESASCCTWEGPGGEEGEAGSKRQKEWMQHLPTHTILAQSSKWSTSLQILSSKFLSIWPMSLVMQRELQLWNRCLCVYFDFDFAPDVRRSKQHQAGTAYPWSSHHLPTCRRHILKWCRGCNATCSAPTVSTVLWEVSTSLILECFHATPSILFSTVPRFAKPNAQNFEMSEILAFFQTNKISDLLLKSR